MAEQKIELRKIRDFSENLNDTFVFIKQNFKSLLTCFVGIAGVFMLGSAILNGFYQSEVGGVFERIFKGSGTIEDSDVTGSIFSPTYFFVSLLAWVNVVAMRVALIAYMKVYERNGHETPAFEEVWKEFSKYFLKVFLYSIPMAILVILGYLFCIVPGVWLWVVLMPFEMILMIENETFLGAWERCFTIIKEHFWNSLAIYLIAYLIYMCTAGIIGGLMSLLTGVFTYFTTKDISTTIGIITSILNIFSFVFFIVFYISAILNYFSLTEAYDSTGLMRKLNNLGGNHTSTNIEEQY